MAKLTKREAKGRTTTTRKDCGKATSREVEDEVPGEVLQSTPLCNVGMSIKRTVSTAEFEGASIEVSLHVPCEQGDVDEAFDATEGWLHEKLQGALAKLGLDE